MGRFQLLFLFCFSTLSFSQSLNTRLVGHVTYKEQCSDVWGYADSAGNEYAIVGRRTGVSFVKVETDMVYEVAAIAGANSFWRDIKTFSHYAYIVNETGGGLTIVDLSMLPDKATIVKNDSSTFLTSHNIYIDSGFLYTASARGPQAGSLILSLSNPQVPGDIASVPADFHDIFVHNNLLYGSTGTRGTLAIFNIKNKANIELISEIPFPSAGYSHNSWATEDDKFVITTEETSGKTVKMWDIRNLNNPVLVSEYLAGDAVALAHNVVVSGDYAYLSHYAYGIRILDISEPTNMVEVGYYDTYPGDSAGYVGAWGVYPFSPSGYIYGSDIQTGLYVIDFNGRKASRFHGVVKDARTNQPLANATILQDDTNKMTVTDAFGAFRIGYAEPGSHLLRIFKTGYDTTVLSINVTEGQISTAEVLLEPVPSAVQENNQTRLTYRLSQNFPNPFNAGTTITYEIPDEMTVTLTVYDIFGRTIKTLVAGFHRRGEYRVIWSGTTDQDRRVSSGVYLFELKTPNFRKIRKMLLVQ